VFNSTSFLQEASSSSDVGSDADDADDGAEAAVSEDDGDDDRLVVDGNKVTMNIEQRL
jgi:hypothetical protein